MVITSALYHLCSMHVLCVLFVICCVYPACLCVMVSRAECCVDLVLADSAHCE